MKSPRNWVVVWTCGWAFLSGLSALSQAQQIALPSGWQQLSNDDFAAAVRKLYTAYLVDRLSPAEHDAVRAEGHTRFLQIDLSNTPLSYQTLEMIHWLTRFNLDQETLARSRTALLSRKDDWTGQPFHEIWSKVEMMNRLDFDDLLKYQELLKWVAAGGTLDQMAPTELRFYGARHCLAAGQIIMGAYSIEWNGLVTAPQTGQYVFSISPINVNSLNPHGAVKFAMTVSVGGQQVLNSSPDETATTTRWVSAGRPITLTAGQAAPLKVTLLFDAPIQPDSTLHAQLFWQGPGMEQTIVPATALAPPTGGGTGLRATYSWTSDNKTQSLTRLEQNIDVCWSFGAILLASNSTLPLQAAEKMWTALTADDFLQTCLGPPLLTHPFFPEAPNVTEGLTTAQRHTFHTLLLENPTLLDHVTTDVAVRFYQSFRFGDPETALDVFGTWAQRHADLVCVPTAAAEFDSDNRWFLALLAKLTTLQLPHQIGRLQNEYLQTTDGRCSLPVAYALAASYQGRGKLDDWTAFLDSRLGDNTLGGDLRVNWLIARAEAEEIRQLPEELDIELAVHARPRPLDGRGYLDQALQAAQSPATKARVAQEIASRLVWSGEFQAAQELVQQTSRSLTGAPQAALAALQTQIVAWTPNAAQTAKDQAAAANQAYLKTLQQRRDQAAARGDTAAVTRYNGLISAASDQK